MNTETTQDLVRTTTADGQTLYEEVMLEADDEAEMARTLPMVSRGLTWMLLRALEAAGAGPGTVAVSKPDQPPSVCVIMGGITREYRWSRDDVSDAAKAVMADYLLWLTLNDLDLFPEEYNDQEFA